MGSSKRTREFRLGPKTVHLSCGHELQYNAPYPRLSELLWCRRCGALADVAALSKSYAITCDGCTLSVRYGADLVKARRTASRHVLMRPSHSVSLLEGLSVVELVTNHGTQDELPYERILTERQALVRRNQQALRDFLDKR